jgi:hypothetical protein
MPCQLPKNEGQKAEEQKKQRVETILREAQRNGSTRLNIAGGQFHHGLSRFGGQHDESQLQASTSKWIQRVVTILWCGEKMVH